MKTTFVTILAWSAGIANAQSPFSNLSSVDAHAANAVQYSFSVKYGPGSVPGSFACPLQKSTPQGYCLAIVNFNVPDGKRFVIENVSVSFSFNANGSNAIFIPHLNFGVTVGKTTAFSQLPFDTNFTVGNTTYYTMNKNVRLYADAGPGFPELLFSALNAGLGPDLGPATGNFQITLMGYLVDLP